jgi:LmbE family N-acetylglucosaminyl deacetylase
MTWDTGMSETKVLEALASALAGDHRKVHELARRLGRAEGIPEIAAAVEELNQLLGPHFADEERAHGLYDSLAERRPEYGAALAALREEHEQILSSAQSLRRQVADQEASPHGLAEEAGRLSALLFDHERRESALATGAES